MIDWIFSREFIKDRFDYNPETGEVINKFKKKPVTYKDKDGYIVCGCMLSDGRVGRMRAARLALDRKKSEVCGGN